MANSARLVAILLMTGALAACERTKSYNPLSSTIAGPLPNISMTPPQPIQPHNGEEVLDTEQPLVFVMANPTSSSPRPFSTEIQIATDQNFTNVIASRAGAAPGDDGLTRVSLGDRLATGQRYYWRGLAEDGANTSGWSPVVAFDVVIPVVLDPPVPMAPIANAQVTTVTPELRARHGGASGPHGQLFYQFQIGRGPDFSSLVANEEVPRDGGSDTEFTSPPLPRPDTPYYWRVRQYDAKNISSWSRVEVFRSPPEAAPPPPPPSGPAPGGGTCTSSSPEAIVACERSKWGFMSRSQLVDFLRAVADSLNRNNISGGPFGILRKTSGNNCNGYSCDIICSGQGSSQKQWDVLIDIDNRQGATWNGPHTGSDIRSDFCEIQ